MLSDHDLEATLRRYRVTDPPIALGPAIVAGSVDQTSRFEWMWGPAAAAAVVVIWLAVHVAMTEAPIDPARAEEVAFVTGLLGGGPDAAAYAELVVPVPAPKPDPLVALAEDPWQEN